MLELINVTKKFNGVAVVNGVGFRVLPGEIVGYLGPNGAGKSTTVKMIAGLLEQNSGEILFRGVPIIKDFLSYKARVGYVPEQGELYTHLTGLEYLLLVGRLRGIPEQLLFTKISGILEVLGMTYEMYLSISGYSKGMKQKILIAAALLHDPDLLLLDEPLSGLDVSTMLIIKDLFLLLSGNGKTIVYSSHVLDVVEKVCSRVIILNKGKVVADDSVDRLGHLMRCPSLEAIFRQLVQQQDTVEASKKIHALMSAC